MFALLETEYTAGRRAWGHTVEIRRAGECKVAVARVRRAEGGGARRYERALGGMLSELNGLGIRMAVVTDGFEGAELLPRYGLSPPAPDEVFRRLVPVIAAGYAKEAPRGSLKAAVITGHVGRTARKAVSALLPYTSNLCVIGVGAAELCGTLRAVYGLAAQCSEAALNGVQIAVCLKPWEDDFTPMPESTLILAGGYSSKPVCHVVDGAPPPRGEAPPPPNTNADMWNAALFLNTK